MRGPEPPLHPRRWWRWWWLLVIVVGMAAAYGLGWIHEWIGRMM